MSVGAHGRIHVDCRDPLTGGPASGAVLARLDGARGAQSLPAVGRCGGALTGLPAGRWVVHGLPELWRSEAVQLSPGAEIGVLLGEDDSPPAPLGLRLASDGQPGVRIDHVAPEGLGAELGLRPGDRIVGGRIGPAPLPLDALLGERAEVDVLMTILEVANAADAAGLLQGAGLELEVVPGPDAPDTGGAPPPG